MFQVLEIALKERILRLAGDQWLRISNERSSIVVVINIWFIKGSSSTQNAVFV